MSCKSGSAFSAAFEFAVQKQDHLPLVRAIDYAHQAPIDSILGGPLFASPEKKIKQEEESIVLTLVEEFINLVYPQVPPFPHVEDYLWPDFSDDANAFFEQFKEQEELPSYRSESPRLLLRFFFLSCITLVTLTRSTFPSTVQPVHSFLLFLV